MTPSLLSFPLLLLPVVPVACGSSSSPADVGGDYTVALTDGNNGCQFSGWTQGQSTTGVDVVVSQQGSSATGTVNGLAAAALDLTVGTNVFQGTVSGDALTLTAVGSTPYKSGQCTYTIDATLAGTLTGDAIQGTVTYTEKTNGSSDCTYQSTCSSAQSFAGARAPRAGTAPADAGAGG